MSPLNLRRALLLAFFLLSSRFPFFPVRAAEATSAPTATAEIDFQRDIRPLLSRHCFKCHGPDDKARKAKLRLDLRDDALRPAKSGKPAIVPGQPAASELLRRITTTDATDLMPPPETKNPLTAAQQQLLHRWIAAGAEYRPHWAFVAPKPAPLPRVLNERWPRNPIDHFVLARLEAAGLQPSPPADRYTLVRRVYLDLIGLPPTLAEIDDFVLDASPRAYEDLVERLLASKHYGERWARRWLDLARYADTNGYEKDRQRTIWPWRDWVINALNADLPFNQFTLEQLAGDLLPNATREQRIATGFHRNTMLNEEGGIDPLEFRFHAMTDRVGTTGTTWLGLTLQCAQCHTHKYDPIPQREYYQVFAALNNADEPDLDLPAPDADALAKTNAQKLEQLLAELPAKFPEDKKSKPPLTSRDHLAAKYSAWIERERPRAIAWTVLRPIAAKSNLPLLTVQPDDSVFASGDTSKQDTYELKFRTELRGITAIRLEALPDDRLPAHGPGMAYYEGPKGDFFLGEFQLHVGGKPVKLSSASQDYAKIWLGGNRSSAALAIDGDPQTGWGVFERYGQRHAAVFQLAAPLADAGEFDLKLFFGRHYACSLGRFRIAVTSETRAAEATDLPDEIARLLRLPDAQLTAADRDRLRRQFLLTTPELATARAEIDKLRKPPVHPTTLVLRERPAENPRPTFIHNRGEFLQPTERVEPGGLSALPPFPADAPRNRLGLARWIVAPENPLTARVTVNRQWAGFFGHGLVRTTEDFGFQGEAPSHPALLDWLALEFMRQGWSLKRLHKLIVLSATYQQMSGVTPDLLARDPEHRLLSRGPRVRLEAEMIRDAALRASGLLSDQLGGPSVFPPQPPGVTTEGAYGSLAWNISTGPDRYRRGLYTFTKRTAPFAMFTTFDAPSGEASVARREVSNTPLQALTLLNDPVFTEAAQALGRLLATDPRPVKLRLDALFRRCLSRPATMEETTALTNFLTTQQARFTAKELNATLVAGPGDGDVNARAAWTAVARVLLNLDEAINKS